MSKEELIKSQFPNDEFLQSAVLQIVNKCVSDLEKENAELKKNALVWHKVADGDYPPCEKGNYSINILTDKGNIAYYNYDMECWVAEPSSAEIDPPVAWCELPTFDKG